MATTYKVVKGDTLSSIAQKYKGDYGYSSTNAYMNLLVSLNNIVDPNKIYIGQVIKLTGVPTNGSSGSSSGSSNSANKSSTVTITAFGLQSNVENTLFATWNWNKDGTESYKVEWTYTTGDKSGGQLIWFVGESQNITVDKDNQRNARIDTFSIPSNAKQVRFRVKPISIKTKDSKGNEKSKWTASWSSYRTYTVVAKTGTPSVPTVEINQETLKLTASIDNIDATALNASSVLFQLVRDDKTIAKTGSAKIDKNVNFVTYSCYVLAGAEYKVRCRAYGTSGYGEWTAFSSSIATRPSAPSGIKTCKAKTKTSVYLEWDKVNTATSYDIEFATKKEYFDITEQTTVKNGITTTKYELTGLESGYEYFFRIRAVNGSGTSKWSSIKSVIVGSKPSAPTTWSSTTTTTVDEELVLYWVHNAEDNSSQTYAELELIVDGVKETKTIKNTTDEEEKDKTSRYVVDTSKYREGVEIQWRVRTSGVTGEYGDWSIQRTVDVYAKPTIQLNMTDVAGDDISVLKSFPFYISAETGPRTQIPIGYHVTIIADEIYETVDDIGNVKMVNKGDAVYSKYFDTSFVDEYGNIQPLMIEMSAGNVDLENNIGYIITCTASMDSGLTVEDSIYFRVLWDDTSYEPNAEITLDESILATYIRPYCEEYHMEFRKVVLNSDEFIVTDEVVEVSEGEPVLTGYSDSDELDPTYTTTGEQVFYGKTPDGRTIEYTTVDVGVLVDEVTLAVYRREFDGRFVEISSGLPNNRNVTVTDPHPALDYARYRIVATNINTGSVSYNDLSSYVVGCHSIIIQWDEAWTSFETSEDADLEQPSWAGSMLKLPYDIDVSNSYNPDVSLISYAGRENPVTYYGTHKGETATWNVNIEKKDIETLYALRRLAIYPGDVYVREPSGSGYWANIGVSFSQKHCDLIIPVSLCIKRVEGGI
jgi:hypothetical protein